MHKGWIKLHRTILANHFLMNDDNAFLVFIKLLMLVELKSGDWTGGRHQLAKLLNMNDRTLYGVLIRLEKHGMIERHAFKTHTTIHLCNWTKFQDLSTRSQQQITQKGRPKAKIATGSATGRATDIATGKKQGSQDFSQQPEQPPPEQESQLLRNNSATTAQHSYKNKEGRIKNIKKDLNSIEENPGADRQQNPGPGYKKAVSIAEEIKKRRYDKGSST